MSGPWQSYEEYQVDVALESALTGTPPEQSRPLFPPRHGPVAVQATINDVLNIGQRAPNFIRGRANDSSPKRSWLSGMPVRRSVMSDQSWSGTARNAMSEGVW